MGEKYRPSSLRARCDLGHSTGAQSWPLREELLSRVLRHLPETRGLSALELGCGEGQNLVFLAKRGFSIEGVDISDVALNKARANAEREELRGSFVRADITNYEIQGRFTLILLPYVLHYVGFDEAPSVACEIKAGIVKGMMKHTHHDGINAIEAFEAFPRGSQRAFSFEGRLKRFYERHGWEILDHALVSREYRASEEEGMLHMFMLIARRPSGI